MKLVISRKGFDSASGGFASPILPDGRLISLPIPSSLDQFTFNDLNEPEIDTGELIADLTRQRFAADSRIHLDPDLDRSTERRLPGWRPALGQISAAQTHLANNGVGVGDLFLFFGWFRDVERKNGRWRYVPDAPDLHVVFGWLEVGDILPLGVDRAGALRAFPWIADHPHVANPAAYTDENNTLYAATEKSAIRPDSPFGGGRLSHFNRARCLTAPNVGRSKWELPSWFHPSGRPALTYHGSPKLWCLGGDKVLLSTVGRGQEFVIDGKYYPELWDWAASIIREI